MLLSNWLGTLTSRIKKRPVYRSRDRRALRRRWQAAVHNQIATTEILEDRTLLTTFGLQSELLPDDLATTPQNGDYFGYSVAVDGDWMVVGARLDNNENGTNAGAVTLYSRNDTGTPADQSDDTWDFHSTILSPSGVAPDGDRFGWAVDIDGDSLIVSAIYATDGETRGSAYIFTRTDPGMSPTDLTDDVWVYTKTLFRPSGLTTGPNLESDDFGVSVSISGSTAVVGVHYGDLNATLNSGAVYVFDTADNWGSVSVSAITAGDPASDSRFGYSVSISGDTILAGAWLDDTEESGSGAVYVFERNDQALIGDITDDTWDQSAKLKSPDVQLNGGYGFSVDLDGDIAVVGARSENFSTSTDAGAAYVYDGSTGWSTPAVLARLAASDANSNGYFGHSVSIDGDLVVVGTLNAEAIYVYDGSTGWGSAVEQIIPKPGVPTSDEFGYSVSISGETIAVGAYDAYHDYGAPTGTVYSGTAYAFGVTPPPAVVYVDDNFSNPVAGQDPDDAGLATNFGYDAFATIQEAIDAVADGGTIHIAAGTYSGLISLNKSVNLLGANAGIDPNAIGRAAESIINHDGLYAIQPTADDATIDGFSFEGDGGRVIDSFASADNLIIANNIFNNTNIPGVQGGIQLQSGSFDDLTVEQNLFQFTGDGDALVVGAGGSFERMHIVGNHFAGTTGGIFQNGGTINDAVVEQNEFTGSVGMNMGDAGNIQIRENTFDGTFSTGFQVGTIDGEIVGNTFQNIEAIPGFFGQAFELWGGQYGTTVSENVTIENNVIHYNDVAGAAEPTHGIRLRLPDGGSGIDASTIHINNNAFLDGGVRGDAKAIRHFGDQTTAADASGNWWGTTNESSIAALMEDADGGTPLMVDFTSFLNVATDVSGAAGFQGDFSTLNVTALGAQTGPTGRIQEAIDSAAYGATINILAGTYAGNVDATGIDITLAPGNSPGQVTIDGNLTLNGDDTLEIEINNAVAGTGYDQFVVNGAVNLGGAALTLIDGYNPAEGDQFMLIDNNLDDAVPGLFAGLPEGYEFENFLGVADQSAYLTYAGGDGNDVVIVVEDSTPEIPLPTNGTPDEYTVAIVDGNVVTTDMGGNIIDNRPLASLEGKLVINGAANENDTLIVDLTGIDENTLLQIEFNGGAGGHDTLELVGGGLASIEYLLTNASDGSVRLNGSMTDFIIYTGLEPVVAMAPVGDVTLTFGAFAETINVNDAGGGQIEVTSTAGETHTFNNPTGTLTLNTVGGMGVDTININGVDAAFMANLTVQAGSEDVINIGTVDIDTGLLTLSAGAVNVNGAVTANGGVDIDSTLGNITFTAPGVINAGNAEIDLTSASNVNIGQVITTSEVRITASNGGINDLLGLANNVTADRVALTATAMGGISSLNTNVNTLAASATGGVVSIDNTGDLEIGAVGSETGITANASTVYLTTTGQLTVTNEVSAEEVGYLRSVDAAGAGQNIIVNADITSTSGDLNLQAGDNFTMGTSVELEAIGGELLINIDNMSADGVGGIANLNGMLTATGGISVTGNSGADQVIIDGNGGATNDGGTVDGIQSTFTFIGGGGTDELIVDDSGDGTGDAILIGSTIPGSGAVAGAGGVSLGFEGLENLTLFAGSDADTITVAPNVTTAIDIRGGNPMMAPGDTLIYQAATSTYTPTGPGAGTIGAVGVQDVVFDGIEALTFSGSHEVEGTTGDDVLTITATGTNSGTYQLGAGPVVTFSGLTDFTFNGGDGDDRLVIDNAGAGGVFNPSGGITFNGEGNTAVGDSLHILGGTATTVSHSFTSNSSGSVSYNGGGTAITYTGLEPILDTIVAANRTFDFLGADETIILSDGGILGQSFIDSGLAEEVIFVNPTASLTINSLNGTDAININGVDADFVANLTVNASTNDTITTTNVNIGAGLADLNADQVNVNGTLTANGGVDIDANTGLTFAGAGIIAAGGSNIDLTAVTGNIALGQATTGGDVTVTATAGAITDANVGANNITATNATLVSGMGAGVGTILETSVTALEASIGGELAVSNDGALNIGFGMGGVTVGGEAFIVSAGTMTVTENIQVTGGNLTLRNSSGNFVLNTSTTISNNSTFGIDINSLAGAVTLAEGSEVTSSGTGTINILAGFDIDLANVNTGGEVQVTAGGSITDNTTMSEAALIDANMVALRAGTDIGATGDDDIDLNINTLAANATNGDIFLQDPSLTTVGTVNGLAGITAAGNINLDNGFLNLNEKIEATGAASTIVVNSSAAIFANDIVRTDGGTIDLLANAGLSLFSGSLIDTMAMAHVTLAADNDGTGGAGGGAFTQFNSSVVNAHGGDLDVSAAGDVSLVNLQSAGGLITIDSTDGAILDVSSLETALITGASVAMSADTGIGAAGVGDIDTVVTNLAATTNTGNIEISNTGALTIDTIGSVAGVVTGAGSVTVSAASPITVASSVSGAGTVTLTAGDSAAAGDNLTINAGITVQSAANVVLTAGDNFTMDSTSSILAGTTIAIFVDPTAGDPDAVGGILSLAGIINAAGGTTLTGGDDNDIFNVLPSGMSAINVIGGDPTSFPGDILNIDLTGLMTPVLTLGAAAGSGNFSFIGDPQQDVTYSSIENVNTLAAAYHLVLDMVASGYEDTSADTIDATLDAGGTNLVLDVNTTNIFTGADADILSFTVLGSTDADTLNINESAGGVLRFTEAAPAGIPGSMGSHLNAAADSFLETEFNPTLYDANNITLHYDGGLDPGMGGPTIDTINVNFTTDHHVGYFSDLLDNQGSGNIVAAETGVAVSDIDFGLSFGNVELVGINGTAAGSLLVDASSTSGTTLIELEDFGTNADGISELRSNGGLSNTLFSGFDDLRVISGLGSETIDLISLDPTSSLTNIELDAGSSLAADPANDIIRVRSTSAGVTNIDILAGLGNDSIQIYDGTNTVDNINGAISIFGEGGNDTLTVIDSGDSTAPGDVITVTSTTISGLYPATITFTDIDTLNVTGTGGVDTINVNFGAQLDLDFVNINGSDGDDVFNLNTSTPDMVDTRLNGNAGADDFIFMAGSVLRGFIDGGADFDTIDYSNYTTAIYIALATLGTTDGFRGRETTGSFDHVVAGADFDNIDDLVGTSLGANDTLQGANFNNYWGITSNNGGFVIADRTNLMIGRPTTPADAMLGAGERRINFASFEDLVGGTQDDRFDLTDTFGLTGSLNGGAGNDSLDYRDYTTDINVNLVNGTATNIGGNLLVGTGGDVDNSIENVFGGNGDDLITGDNDHNILGDGFGDDTLDGGDGNDVFLMEPGLAGSEDVITDIHGNDTIDFRFASQGIVFDADILNVAQTVFGSSTVELRQIQPQQPDTNPSFMENVVGSEFNDTIFIDPLSQDGNDPIDGPPVLRSVDGRGGMGDVLDFDAKGQEVIDTGFSLTSDGVGTVQYLNFETVRPFEDSPAFIVDNGDQGFTLSGDWSLDSPASTFNGIGFGEDVYTVLQSTPTGIGDAQAFWEFFGLTPGNYRVSVTWPAFTNPSSIASMATNAPFTVYDGARTDVGTSAATVRGTTAINQQLAPDDFTADGTVWEDLGVFEVNNRTLTVMLSNLTDGRIIADAIRIERVSDGPEVELRDVTDLVAPPTIVVDGQPGGIDFGATELLTPAVRSFEITNRSTTDVLTISNIDIPAGFTTNLGSVLTGPIAIGATVAFTITMDATTFGDRSGIFSFETDDEDEAVFNILLDGQVSNVVIIDDGDAEFSAPDFVNFPTSLNQGSSGYEGDVTAAIPNQPGNTAQPGAATATWTFTGLAAGNYQVSTTWSPFYNRVDDAPYSLDGGAGTFDVDVNQKVFPSSFTENGTAWFELIDSFEVSASGVLTVTLTNDANSFPRDNFDGAYGVIADAIRIEYLPEPDIEVMVDGEVVDDDTGNVDFGSTLPGVPVSKTFTITNLSSTLPVDVTGLLEFPPGFSISPTSPFGTDDVPVTIAAGDSVTFIVQFDGGTTGSTTGLI